MLELALARWGRSSYRENPKARPVASIQLVPCRLDMSLFLVISRKSAFGAILKASCLRCRSFLHSVLIKKPVA